MKQIYEKKQQIRINSGEWEDVSFFTSTVYEEPQDKLVWYTTFETLYNAVNNGEIKNAYTSRTFWRKIPCIQLSVTTEDFPKTITTTNFNKVEMRVIYAPLKRYTIKQLADWLSADDFIDYCKDRGVAVRVD